MMRNETVEINITKLRSTVNPPDSSDCKSEPEPRDFDTPECCDKMRERGGVYWILEDELEDEVEKDGWYINTETGGCPETAWELAEYCPYCGKKLPG